ncbi:MAG: DUF58 domain-containing protein, partial [Planctomycetota bacterium]
MASGDGRTHGPRATAAGASAGTGAAIVGRRYEPTVTTPVYMLLSLFLAIGAINSQNNMLFVAFGIAVGLMIVSGVVSGSALMGLRVERFAPASGRAGEELRVRYAVTQCARIMPAIAIEIGESSGPKPRRGDVPPGCVVTFVPPRGMQTAASIWTPARRGVVSLDRFELSTTFPLGLLRKCVVFEQRWDIAIGPPRVEVTPAALPSAARQSGRSTRSTRKRGIGEETLVLRDYSPGDSPRLIAWRPSAGSGSLVVRQTAMPTPPTLELRVSLGETGHLNERALGLAVSLMERAVSERWSVTLVVDGAGLIGRDVTSASGIRGVASALAVVAP